MVIPKACALSSLLPASTPAITTSVALLTEPVTLAPKFSNNSVASFRPYLLNVPVKTTVFP